MKSAAERISRLARLTPRERGVLMRAWCHLLLVDTALRFLPVTRLLPRAVGPIPRSTSLTIDRISWLLDVARRHCPVRSTCLKEALVLVRLLRAEGFDATMKIGVARRDGRLRAHAWIEHDGRIVLGGSDHENYAALLPVDEALAAR